MHKLKFKNTNERKNNTFLFQGWKVFFLVIVFFIQNFSAQIFVSKGTSIFFSKESEVFAHEIEASEGSKIIVEKNNSAFQKAVKETSNKKISKIVYSGKKTIVKKTKKEIKRNNVFVFYPQTSKDNVLSWSYKLSLFVSQTSNNYKDLVAFIQILKKKNHFSLIKSTVLFSYENSKINLVSPTHFFVRPPPTSPTV